AAGCARGGGRGAVGWRSDGAVRFGEPGGRVGPDVVGLRQPRAVERKTREARKKKYCLGFHARSTHSFLRGQIRPLRMLCGAQRALRSYGCGLVGGASLKSSRLAGSRRGTPLTVCRSV